MSTPVLLGIIFLSLIHGLGLIILMYTALQLHRVRTKRHNLFTEIHGSNRRATNVGTMLYFTYLVVFIVIVVVTTSAFFAGLPAFS